MTADRVALLREHKAAIVAELAAPAAETLPPTTDRVVTVWPADSPVPTIHGKWRRLPTG